MKIYPAVFLIYSLFLLSKIKSLNNDLFISPFLLWDIDSLLYQKNRSFNYFTSKKKKLHEFWLYNSTY